MPSPSPNCTADATAPPLLSIVIPLFNCLPLTQAMLASLDDTLPPAISREIILVDDGSTDGTREWLGTLRRRDIRVLLNERNYGYARANNRGVALARGTLLALLNNDLVLLPGWLEPMLAAHETLGPRAGAIGNVQRDAGTGAVDHAGIVINVQGKPVHARSLPRQRRGSPAFFEVPAVTGACLLIARQLWHDLGGFDEAYVNGGEDVDLCFRARAAGRINVVAVRSVIRHHVSSSAGRKLRDEQNSYRLVLTWGREFLAAADFGAREWSRAHLARSFIDPRAAEFATTLRALAYVTHFRRSMPPEAERVIETGQQREFARWRKMFGDDPSLTADLSRPRGSAGLREPRPAAAG